jgi:translation initiation factor 4B
MRPDAAKSPEGTPETSTPSSPVPHHAAPATRPRLNLAKRTVSEAEPAAASATSDSKSNPFGAARPIDTAAREKEIEEKRQLALRQKKEADEKAREEKRTKEAADKAAKSSVPPTPTTEKPKEGEATEQPKEILRREEGEDAPVDAPANGNIVDDKAVKPNEVVRDAPSKPQGSWRRQSNNNTAAAPAAETTTTEQLEDDGWSTVPAKSNKKQGRGAPARAIAS